MNDWRAAVQIVNWFNKALTSTVTIRKFLSSIHDLYFQRLNVKRHEFSHVCIWFDAIRCSSFVCWLSIVILNFFFFFFILLFQLSQKKTLWEYHIHLIEPETLKPKIYSYYGFRNESVGWFDGSMSNQWRTLLLNFTLNGRILRWMKRKSNAKKCDELNHNMNAINSMSNDPH